MGSGRGREEVEKNRQQRQERKKTTYVRSMREHIYVAVASNYFEQRPPCLGPTLKRACFMKFDQNQLQLNIYPKASARFEDPQAEALLGY